MESPNPARPLPRRRTLLLTAAVALIALCTPLVGAHLAGASSPGAARAISRVHRDEGPKPTIVLVHGDWADGSSWNGVISRLQRRGFTVLAPPNPLRGPTSDSAYLASFLATVPGPIVLVGHSYGGFVITNAARGNPNVKALVFIDAFVPDTGQTLAGLTANSGSCLDPATAFKAVPSAEAVDLYLNVAANPPYTGFNECFANGVPRRQAAVLAATQRPAAVAQFADPSGEPAWRTIPSWALIGLADHAVPPALLRSMAENAGAHISTVNAGHLSLVTRPDAVVRLIRTAVRATS